MGSRMLRLSTIVLYLYAIAMAAVFILPVGAEGSAEQPSKTAQEDYAPDFTLPALEGGSVSLDQFKGRPVLLYFMTTWCHDCSGMIPEMKRRYEEYEPQGLKIISISVLESRKKVESYAKKHNIPYPILLDENGEVAKEYRVVGVPVLALIDRERRIVAWNSKKIDQLIEKQLSKKNAYRNNSGG